MAKGKVMALREESKQLSKNAKNEMRQLYEKVKQRPLTCLICIMVIVTAAVLLIALPHWQVSGINNVTEKVTQENQSRATLAQILGGIAVGIGIYFAWGNLKVAQSTFESNQTMAQKSLKVAQEGQITERFTRAIEQLGSNKIEIRLGGIYALERIADESEKDYWPIMKILAAYIREKSSIKDENKETKDSEEQEKDKTLPTDIQVIFEFLCSRKHSFKGKLDLQNSNLRKVRYFGAHLEYANLSEADLWGADLVKAHLEDAYLVKTNLERAVLINAHLEHSYIADSYLVKTHLGSTNLNNACFTGCHLEDSILENAILSNTSFGEENHLERANLKGSCLVYAYLAGTHLEEADFEGADLWEADLTGANLKGAKLKKDKNLTIEQLSKVKTLYNAKLDPKLEEGLRKKYLHLFDEPKNEI